MKKNSFISITITLLALSFVSINTFSQQWVNVNTGISDVISSVTYLDESTLYALCMDGNIYISTDGGYNWTVSYTGSTMTPMQTITSFDASVVISAGYDGTILRNDGSGWQNIPSGTTYSLTGISFAGSSADYAVGENGTILINNDVIVGLKDPPPAERSSLLYPNPSRTGVCFIKGEIPADGIYLKITDLNGKIVHESTIHYPLTPVNLRNLSNGTYLVNIGKGERTFAEKLILIR